MRWELHHGRILTHALEAHVVDHCNLRCADCCSLSPELAARFTSPDTLARELALARQAVAPSLFKLTGGEPLLHPELLALLDVARAAQLAPAISVTTNGLLLRAQPDAFWERIDRLTVSHYASAPLPPSTLAWIHERAARAAVRLTVKHVSHFQALDAPAPQDETATRAAFDGCWMKRRCHLVHAGRFFVCTRPPHLAVRTREPLDALDGVPLDTPDLARAVLTALERSAPLAACRHCLGNTGVSALHRQLPLLRGKPQAV